MGKPKVVILHDWLVGFRGGERVLEAICEMFPDAPIYTLIHKPDSTSQAIESHKITPSFLNKIPGIFDSYRKFLPLFPSAVNSLHITESADLVISSCHNLIKGVKKPKGAKHLCYIHSPMRYMYDQYDVYFGPQAPMTHRLGAKIFKNYLTQYDLKTNQNVDHFVANSHFVASRVKNFYNRESSVVHPFVDLKDFENLKPTPKEDYFLMVTAFAPNKRVDLAIQACNQLKLNLKIIGSGQQQELLKAMAGPTIEFLGNLSRPQVIEAYCKAQALIFPGVEDFGITPLEALAAGTPVIALEKGGVLETLNSDVAVFFKNETEDELVGALTSFNNAHFVPSQLKARAHDFSKEKFTEGLNKEISSLLET